MRRRLILGYVAVAAVVLIALEVPLGVIFARRERDNVTASLQRDASVLAVLAAEPLSQGNTTQLAALVASYRERSGYEAIIVDRQGVPVAWTEAGTAVEPGADIGASLPRILAGNAVSGTQRDEGDSVFFAGLAVREGSQVVGGAQLTFSTATVEGRTRRLWLGLAALAGGILAGAVMIGWLLARWIIDPLRRLESAAVELGDGRLASRAPATTGPPEVRALATSFNQMAGRLEELVHAQARFVADASHQLRSPLTALRLRLENLPEGPEADAAVREVQRLSRIIDGLLVLSRAEGTRPERKPVDTVAVIEERRQAWAALAEERQVTLRSFVRGLATAYAWLVPGYLEQVLDNLLANALDVAPPGSTVVVAVALAPGVVRISVDDEGPGMSEADRRQAFLRFWRGASERSKSGTGLGLAIVAQLLRACGGTISLESRPGPGLSAVIALEQAPPPKLAPHDAATAAATTPATAAATQATVPGRPPT